MTDATMLFAHDREFLFYPSAPGCVFAIRLSDLARYTGNPADFEATTETTDLAGMLLADWGPDAVDVARTLYPIGHRHKTVPALFASERTGINADGFGEDIEQDFADALEAWADWCDEQVEAEESTAKAAPPADVLPGVVRAFLDAWYDSDAFDSSRMTENMAVALSSLEAAIEGAEDTDVRAAAQ